MPLRKIKKNTRRENRLEELGRVDYEKVDSRKGRKDLRLEKSRIVRELKADGGRVMGRGQGKVLRKKPTFNIHM